METDERALLRERLDYLTDRIREAEGQARQAERRAEEAAADSAGALARIRQREVEGLAIIGAFAFVVAVLGVVSWTSFGDWVAGALKDGVAGETISQLQAQAATAETLVAALERQVQMPVVYLGSVAACTQRSFPPPPGARREDYTLLLVPEVLDTAFESVPQDNRDNFVQMFATHFNPEPAPGTGWQVYYDLRLGWGLTEVYARGKSVDCSDPRLAAGSSTMRVFAVALGRPPG